MDAFEVRGAGVLQAYLRQAVMNRLRDELRRKGRAPAFDDVHELDVAGQASTGVPSTPGTCRQTGPSSSSSRHSPRIVNFRPVL